MRESEGITDKRGGVCFRVDDNQPVRKWLDFAEVFNGHGYRFCAAISFGRMVGDPDYVRLIRELQGQGHEIMDHTPLHSVDKIPLLPGDDPEAWRQMPGVDHVDEKIIYLTYEKIEAASLPGGRCDISGKRMTGRTRGDLSETNRNRFVAVYLPELDRAYRFETTGEAADPALNLQSFWGEEDVDLGERRDLAYHRLSKSDVFMTLEARKRLTEAMRTMGDQFELRRPVTWIQPGSGGCSDLYREAAKECFGDRYGYVSAATYPNRALKCHNEYDPNGDKSFGMQWGDFDDESKDLAWNRKRIADGVARHHVLIGHSHFSERVMPDGWEGYLRRVDRILSWCRRTGIPVRTYSEWAKILYHTPQDPGVNVFPRLDTDRDEDGFPDGYDLVSARVDRDDGAPGSGGVSLAAEEAGPVCRVKGLGGLEKGANTFSIWTRGNHGAAIEVTFTFPEIGSSEKLQFAAENPEWARRQDTVKVPPSASLADIAIHASGVVNGRLGISGMSLKGSE